MGSWFREPPSFRRSRRCSVCMLITEDPGNHPQKGKLRTLFQFSRTRWEKWRSPLSIIIIIISSSSIAQKASLVTRVRVASPEF
ncbi:hypothetical protein EX30DRAFT_250760 [Ascodesmis nigricans]|uniref:Uncharacterized protein n=1 Tax=Ascodesmis nigricans TaxID=341454 RepID=A0A4S2MY04_9PEZI|nr:hypothetical protein EX30DRAFT_250760 [Ascodesmis nigricans]